MQYDLFIEHIDGKSNTVADCLSRIVEELPIEEVLHLPEAQDKIEFPVTLFPTQFNEDFIDTYHNHLSVCHPVPVTTPSIATNANQRQIVPISVQIALAAVPIRNYTIADLIAD